MFQGNAVNFKLVQTVLFLIARQMKILERRVELDFNSLPLMPSDSTLSVTELKVHAMQKKKPPAGAKHGGKGKPGGAVKGKPAAGGKHGKKVTLYIDRFLL